MSARSIYERALGEKFRELHPRIRERFGFASDDGVACVGRGRMAVVRNGGAFTYPFLLAGTLHNVMFPEQGTAVPFSVYNFAYEDEYGRETVTWVREFELPRPRRFDATMIYSEERDRVVDYLGTHQHLAVDIDLAVDEATGGLSITAGDQRLYAFGLGGSFPAVLTGRADVLEWYDDEEERYRIAVHVENPVVGTLFEYRGWFEVEWLDREDVPADVRPVSTTRRE